MTKIYDDQTTGYMTLAKRLKQSDQISKKSVNVSLHNMGQTTKEEAIDMDH